MNNEIGTTGSTVWTDTGIFLDRAKKALELVQYSWKDRMDMRDWEACLYYHVAVLICRFISFLLLCRKKIAYLLHPHSSRLSDRHQHSWFYPANMAMKRSTSGHEATHTKVMGKGTRENGIDIQTLIRVGRRLCNVLLFGAFGI